jgi:hypothetical protein
LTVDSLWSRLLSQSNCGVIIHANSQIRKFEFLKKAIFKRNHWF